MATAIIVIILIVICVFGIKSYAGKLSHGCCGGSSDVVKREKPADTDLSHYPHRYILQIDGMTCKNCAARIENTFNKDESGNFYAKVDLGKRTAVVNAKQETPEEELRRIVIKLGYGIISVKKEA